MSLDFCSVASSFLFWMMEAWTLETAAAPFSPSLHLEMMQMVSFHHGKWTPGFETKRTHLFLVIFGTQDDFAVLNATNIIFKA